MLCPQCGSTVSEDVKFCGTCGRDLAPTGNIPSGFAAPGTPPEMLAPASTSGKAIASLILGIVPLSFISSIPAVVFGHLALSEIKKSAGRLQGRGMAIAGLVLGYIGIGMVPFVLIIAAIAIPNLLRARIAANEASTVSSIRDIQVAQVNYQSDYGAYATTLEALGPPSSGGCTAASASNACLINFALSNTTAATSAKNGYYFTVSGGGKSYFVSAMPAVRNQSGVKSFCSTDDTVVHVDLSGGAITDAAACNALPTIE